MKSVFLPVVIPLLSEGDLHAELHPNIVNFLKTSDKEIDPDQGGAVPGWVPSVSTPMARVHRLALEELLLILSRLMDFIQRS